MSRFHHPVYLGSSATPLEGVWVRHKTTKAVGYVSHVERRHHEDRPLLWIVYPPGRLPNGTKIKTYSAGQAYADEVRQIKNRKRKRL